MKVLITGGAGYIGSLLTGVLRDFELRIADFACLPPAGIGQAGNED